MSLTCIFRLIDSEPKEFTDNCVFREESYKVHACALMSSHEPLAAGRYNVVNNSCQTSTKTAFLLFGEKTMNYEKLSNRKPIGKCCRPVFW